MINRLRKLKKYVCRDLIHRAQIMAGRKIRPYKNFTFIQDL